MGTTYTGVKVHNEIIFCTVYNLDLKSKIEKEFLKNRISYYETWEKVGFFMRLFGKKQGCQICINEMQKDKAEELVDALKLGEGCLLVEKPVERTFF